MRLSGLTVRAYLFSLAAVLATALVHLAAIAQLRAEHREHLILLSEELVERLWWDHEAPEREADVTLYDLQGAIVASTVDPPLPRQPVEIGDSVVHPVRDGGRIVGFGVVSFRHTSSWGALVGPTVGTLLALLIVALLFAHHINLPLQRVTAAARAFGGGDLRARVGRYGNDEIGEVGRAFDAMAEQIVRLMTAQQELLANVSHELRTPLARLQVALDLLTDGQQAPIEELSPIMSQDIRETLRLLDDVMTVARLDLSRAEPAAMVPLRREALSVEALVEQAVSRFRAHHPQRVLAVTLAHPLPALHADPILLRRVLENLLDNSHKYSEPEKPIRMEVRAEGDGIYFVVADEGIGIDEQNLENVFLPFFRADRSRARATGGTGLGLALARRVVEAHGGRVTLESRLGQGAVFTLWLPHRASVSTITGDGTGRRDRRARRTRG